MQMATARVAALMIIAILMPAAADAGSADPHGAAASTAPQRIALDGFPTIYEITSQSCSRVPMLVCTIAVRRVGDGRDNGLVVYTEALGGASTLMAGGRRFPATGVWLADSPKKFAPDKY